MIARDGRPGYPPAIPHTRPTAPCIRATGPYFPLRAADPAAAGQFSA